MCLAFFQAKGTYLLSSLHHLTYFIQDSTYHRMKEGNQEANPCMYLYVDTLTGFVCYCPKTKSLFAHLNPSNVKQFHQTVLCYRLFSGFLTPKIISICESNHTKGENTDIILDEIRNFRPQCVHRVNSGGKKGLVDGTNFQWGEYDRTVYGKPIV